LSHAIFVVDVETARQDGDTTKKYKKSPFSYNKTSQMVKFLTHD
jgi:hypothetical protein